MRLRLIWDDGTPSCLPDWARDELVRRRLECEDLRSDIYRLRVEVAVANGMPPGEALLEAWKEQVERIEALR